MMGKSYLDEDRNIHARGPARTYLQRLEDALYADHPCDDDHCDIAVAMRTGFLRAAAHLLIGATECPNVERVFRGRGRFPREWAAWVRWYTLNTVECSGCNARTAIDRCDHSRCGNCGHALPEVC